MEMLCPECLGPLVTTDGRTARCTLHGGAYRIMFQRGQITLPPLTEAPLVVSVAAPKTVIQPPPGTADNPYRSPVHEVQVCTRHPNVETEMNCVRCGAAICMTCGFPQADGTQVCPDCVSKVRISPSTVRLVPEGVMCSRHPQVQAERYCQSCRAPVCPTCDFALPGGVHLCPNCATKTSHGLSSSRKSLVGWSIALAIWCTLGLVVLLSGALAEAVAEPGGQEAVGIALSIFVYIPSLVGTALSLSALDRRLSNPAVVWVSIVWNVLVLAVLLLLTVVGIFMQ